MSLWEAVGSLTTGQQIVFLVALIVAFGFEFINGFHDTANAVTTVIYTHSLKPTPAVVYSGIMNFLGVLAGGTGVAFGIVKLLPVDLLVKTGVSVESLVMILSILLAGVIWNLGTWLLGLPVSSSHTLVGSILGVGLANSLMAGRGVQGVNWLQAGETMLSLLLSPLVGFLGAGGLFLLARRFIPNPRLYTPPGETDRPPGWVRGVLLATCGGVSFAHGSNDGQKGMGLILLVLIGFMPFHYAVALDHDGRAERVRGAAAQVRERLEHANVPVDGDLAAAFEVVDRELAGKHDLIELPGQKGAGDRWEVRKSILQIADVIDSKGLPADVRASIEPQRKELRDAVQFVPLWVKIGVATALGVGTMIGYKRIVVTVAEKIGKQHLTYAQGAAAEVMAAATIGLADVGHLPVSTTHVLSSGIAGTMAANGAGVQPATVRKIILAWVLTVPAAMVLAAGLFSAGVLLLGRLAFV